MSDNFASLDDFGIDNGAFEDLWNDVEAGIRRDLENQVESLKAQLQQAEQQIASYAAREKQFEEIMAKQRDQINRYESQLSTNTLQGENYRMENVNLVHQNVQLEANLDLERKTSGLKDLELNKAYVLIRKHKKIASDLAAVMKAASERILSDAKQAYCVSQAIAAEIESNNPAVGTSAQSQQVIVLLETPQQPPQ